MPAQDIRLADELTSEQLIDLGRKLDDIRDAAERLNLTKIDKSARNVRARVDLIRLDVLELMAILDRNPR